MKVALVGATGVVGETILRVLEERGLAIDRLDAFASRAREEAVVVSRSRLPVERRGERRRSPTGATTRFFSPRATTPAPS